MNANPLKDHSANLGVVIAGVVGQASALFAFLLALLASPITSIAVVSFPISIFFLFLILLFMGLFSTSLWLRLIAKRTVMLYAIVCSGAIVAAIFLAVVPIGILALPFIALSLISLVVLWVPYLSALKLQLLSIQGIMVSSITGLLGFFASGLFSSSGLFTVLFIMVSVVCVFAISRKINLQIPQLYHRHSFWNDTTDRKKSILSIMLGLMLGVSLAIIIQSSSRVDSVMSVVGAAIILASFAMMVFRLQFPVAFERLVFKLLAAFGTAAILPSSFIKDCEFNICGLSLLLVSLVGTVLMFDSLIKKTHDESSIAEVFRMGALLLLAATFSLTFFWWASNYVIAKVALLPFFVTTVILNLLQIVLNKRVKTSNNRPRNKIIPLMEEKDEEAPLMSRGGAVWNVRLNYLAQKHALSHRQNEIFKFLVKGRGLRYIMDKLGISQSTAKTHIDKIYKKFDVHSRQGLLDMIERSYMPLTQAYENELSSNGAEGE